MLLNIKLTGLFEVSTRIDNVLDDAEAKCFLFSYEKLFEFIVKTRSCKNVAISNKCFLEGEIILLN